MGATLTGTSLQVAFLLNARLQGALLRNARLQLADLRDAQLQGSILHSVKLHGADMRKVKLQGASIGGAGLHEADLEGADLRGAQAWTERLTYEEQQRRGAVQDHQLFSGASVPTFEERIRKSIGQESNLRREVRLEGGLSQNDVEALVEGLCAEDAERLRMGLKVHVDQPVVPLLPEGIITGALFGAYTEEEAETWIAEYEVNV